MILTLLGAATLASAPASALPQRCAAEEGCVETGAAQLFQLADKRYRDGDLAGAAEILRALTQDRHAELRAEARFRLAAVLEKLGDLRGAAATLRELLAEKPDATPARLELARILSRLGEAAEAGAELAKAEAAGLPPEVQVNVRRFAGSLRQERSRGLTVEVTSGPDTNINRSTSSPFVDTIIAPFELDADARRQAGIGYSAVVRGYSRNRLGKLTLLSNGGLRADLFGKARFNDVQLVTDSGPEFAIRKVRARAAAAYERRWFGGDLYSSGVGGSVELLAPLSPMMQAGAFASHVRQDVAKNDGQDGWRTSVTGEITRLLGPGLTGRLSVRYGSLDARVRPESLRQAGGGLLIARQSRPVTVFAQLDYTRTHGIEPLFLFGKTRRDRRWDLTAGAILNQAKVAGFAPLFRLTHSDSRANIVLYDYRRTRLDFGLTRSF